MISSGAASKATTDNNAITLIDGSAAGPMSSEANFINTGAVAGFVSIDGNVWLYMPAGTADAPATRTVNLRSRPRAVKLMARRIADGSDMTGLYADAH